MTTTLPAHLELAHLPTWMKKRTQWVVAGADKIPLNPRSGKRASVTDRTTWGTFRAAQGRAHRDGLHIGWVLGGSDLTAIDIDNCIDDAGNLTPEAHEIVGELNSYTEVSRSGRGLHTLATGVLPAGRRRFPGGIEVYDRDRYILLTGDVRPGWGGSIKEYTSSATLAALHSRLSASVEPETPAVAPPSTPLTMEDADVLDRARGARNGGKFDRLWSGDTSDYGGDDSRADEALCSLMTFWTQDPDQIDRLFRQSALYRDKWERKGYRESTISKAMQRSAFYTPPATIVTPGRTERPAEPTGQDDPSAADPCATERDTIAALRAEVAALKADNAALSRLQSATMALLRSRELQAGEKIIGLVSLFEAEAATTRGATDPEGWTDTPLERIAESAGCSAKVAGKHQATISTTGIIESRTIDRRDPDTGVITKRRQIRIPAPTPDTPAPSLPERIIALSAATPKRDPSKQRWGGRRICDQCGDVGTVTLTTVACKGCGQELSRTTTEQPPAVDASAESPIGQDDLSKKRGSRLPMGRVVRSGDLPYAKERREQRSDRTHRRRVAATDLALREPDYLAAAPDPVEPPDSQKAVPQPMLFVIPDPPRTPHHFDVGD